MDIYKTCPELENSKFKLRLISENDVDDLFSVYSDKFALPFFNSDNCHGSNFYCGVREHMEKAIYYWLKEYHEYKGFVRFTIIDKAVNKAIGTIEMFHRKANDFYNDYGLLRVDVRSDYEKEEALYEILSLIVEPFYDWFDCTRIATKAPLYAVERIEALKKANFVKSEEPIIGHDDRRYYDYWIILK